MRRTIFHLLTILSILLLSSSVSAQNASKENLKRLVALINSECPISLGSVGIIDSAVVEADTVVLEYVMDIPLNSREMASAEDIEESIMSQLNATAESSRELQEFFGLFIESGMSLKCRGSFNEQHFDFTLTPDRIAAIMSGTPDFRKMAETKIRMAQSSLPMNMGAMTITEIKIEGDIILTVCVVDESEMNMDTLINGKDLMKQRLLDILKSGSEPTMSMEIEMYAKGGFSTGYRYVGNTTGKTVSFEITPGETLEALGLQ